MKENKTHTLTTISLALLVLSFILLGIWGYRSFFSDQAHTPIQEDSSLLASDKPVSPAHEHPTGENTLDTLLQNAIKKADSVTAKYKEAISEYSSMRTELMDMLNTDQDSAALETARQKIRDLNRKIDELVRKNEKMERENKKLSIALNRLEKLRKRRSVLPVDQPAVTPPEPIAPEPPKQVKNIQLQNISLSAVYSDGISEPETTESAKAQKLKGSFTCKNLSEESSPAEVVLVLTGPDGKVIQNSWESGLFDTEKGKKTYTSKMRFDIPARNSVKIPFTVGADSFTKGKYSIEIFRDGRSLGKSEKNLN
jgi:regulator of replication initiation timing